MYSTLYERKKFTSSQFGGPVQPSEGGHSAQFQKFYATNVPVGLTSFCFLPVVGKFRTFYDSELTGRVGSYCTGWGN